MGFPTYFTPVVQAHAALGILTFLVLFPAGVFFRILDMPRSRTFHGYVQTFAYCTLTAVVGMGIWMAKTIDVVSLDATLYSLSSPANHLV